MATAASAPSITLVVGGEKFVTTAQTLEGSGYLSSMVTKWAPAEDGSFTLDRSDPVLFRHVLNFLRGGAFPLFWTHQKGFDYDLYASLGQEAEYLMVTSLASWINARKYEQVVKKTITFQVLRPSLTSKSFDVATDEQVVLIENHWSAASLHWCSDCLVFGEVIEHLTCEGYNVERDPAVQTGEASRLLLKVVNCEVNTALLSPGAS